MCYFAACWAARSGHRWAAAAQAAPSHCVQGRKTAGTHVQLAGTATLCTLSSSSQAAARKSAVRHSGSASSTDSVALDTQGRSWPAGMVWCLHRDWQSSCAAALHQRTPGPKAARRSGQLQLFLWHIEVLCCKRERRCRTPGYNLRAQELGGSRHTISHSNTAPRAGARLQGAGISQGRWAAQQLEDIIRIDQQGILHYK